MPCGAPEGDAQSDVPLHGSNTPPAVAQLTRSAREAPALPSGSPPRPTAPEAARTAGPNPGLSTRGRGPRTGFRRDLPPSL